MANNKVERRDVLGGVEVPDAVQVTSGLNAGEVVVVDPPSALGPGTQVQVEGGEPKRGLEPCSLAISQSSSRSSRQ